LAGPDRDLPAPARPVTGWAARDDDVEPPDDEAEPPLAAIPPARAQSSAPRSAPRPASQPPGRPVPPPSSASPRDSGRSAPTPRDPNELFGPAWERPRRYEAYPSLRTRVGLPNLRGIPRLALAGIALVIAAAFLFFVSPMILGLGKDKSPAATPAPSEIASAAPADTPSPTVPPAPTPATYTVVQGDTLSGIAQKFGVTTKALQKANPQIKNPNSIKPGDVLNIPAPAGAAPSGAVSGASPSAVTGASTGP
jgi:LysM repeat protein